MRWKIAPRRLMIGAGVSLIHSKQSAALVYRLVRLLAEVGRCNAVRLAGGLIAGRATSRHPHNEQKKLGSGWKQFCRRRSWSRPDRSCRKSDVRRPGCRSKTSKTKALCEIVAPRG